MNLRFTVCEEFLTYLLHICKTRQYYVVYVYL
jgi:hypothetical protein